MNTVKSIRTLSLKEKKFLEEFFDTLGLGDEDVKVNISLATNKRHVVGLYVTCPIEIY